MSIGLAFFALDLPNAFLDQLSCYFEVKNVEKFKALSRHSDLMAKWVREKEKMMKNDAATFLSDEDEGKSVRNRQLYEQLRHKLVWLVLNELPYKR